MLKTIRSSSGKRCKQTLWFDGGQVKISSVLLSWLPIGSLSHHEYCGRRAYGELSQSAMHHVFWESWCLICEGHGSVEW